MPDIEPVARAAEEAGADALSLVNTFVSLAIERVESALLLPPVPPPKIVL